MSKTRLNNGMRSVLMSHAIALTCESSDMDDLREAQVEYFDAMASLYVAIYSAVEKSLNAKDMEVLKRHNMTEPCCHVSIANPDAGDPGAALKVGMYQFNLNDLNPTTLVVPLISFNKATRKKWDEEVTAKSRNEGRAFDFRARCSIDMDLLDVTKGATKRALEKYSSPLIIPGRPKDRHGYQPYRIQMTAPLSRAIARYEAALQAERRENKVIHDDFLGVQRDYYYLISQSRIFEELVEIWPEAADVTHIVTGSGTELAALPAQVVSRIKQNIATRVRKE